MSSPDTQSVRARGTARSSSASRDGAGQPVTGAAAHEMQETHAPEPDGDASTAQPRALRVSNNIFKRTWRALHGLLTSVSSDTLNCTKRSEFLAVDKQLAQYFKNASAMTWPLFIALISSTSCHEKRRRILAFRICSAISLTLNLVPLFGAGWMAEKEKPSSETVDEDYDDELVKPRDRNRIRFLSIIACLSNVSLTVTTISFAMLLKADYAWCFFILVLHMLLYISIIWYWVKHGLTWGLVQYKEHRSDIDFFFRLCFEITQTNFTALSATWLGYLQTGQCMDVKFRGPEIILLVAVGIGLFITTMCTVLPAAPHPDTRDFLVRVVLRIIVYLLLLLTSIGLFWAVISISSAYLWLSIAIPLVHVVLYLSDFRTICPNDFETQEALAPPSEAGNAIACRTGHDKAADENSLKLFSFHSIMSGALMASYSLDIRDQNTGTKVSLIVIYAAILAYLGMVIITREATNGKIFAVRFSRITAGALFIASLVCVLVFLPFDPLRIGSSSP